MSDRDPGNKAIENPKQSVMPPWRHPETMKNDLS